MVVSLCGMRWQGHVRAREIVEEKASKSRTRRWEQITGTRSAGRSMVHAVSKGHGSHGFTTRRGVYSPGLAAGTG